MSRYLIGDFSGLGTEFDFEFSSRPVFKYSVSKDDLVKSKDSRDFQIIDLEDRTYFNAGTNKWEKLEVQG